MPVYNMPPPEMPWSIFYPFINTICHWMRKHIGNFSMLNEQLFCPFLQAVSIFINSSIMSSYLYFCGCIVYSSAHMGMVVALFLTSVVACDLNFTHGFNFPLGFDSKSIIVYHISIYVM